MEGNNDTVVICGPLRFPYGDASSNRVMAIAKAVQMAGWKVLVIGTGVLREQDLQPDGTYKAEGIEYATIYPQTGIPRYRKALRLLAGGLPYYRVMKARHITKPAVILSYGGYFFGNYIILPMTLWQRKTRFIVDVVEWYSSRQFRGRWLNHRYIDAQLAIRLLYPLARNLIVISRLLESYYLAKGCRVIRIPPILDVASIQLSRRPPTDAIRLIYAGIPAKKDYLDVVIRGLALLTDDERARVEFHLYGPTKVDLRVLLGCESSILDDLADCVFIHGRISKVEVLKALSESHFTVLLRPQLRYANAGFPSKVPESLAAGTPVMLNYTSDLMQYIHDGIEGIIVENCTPDAFLQSMRRVLALTPKQLDEMSKNARRCAEKYFDYRLYLEQIRTFLT